ncbi:MAG: flagellar filament capping protein FliD [Selenomonadaceae bacterium]|nr:flagellar filament capping protein FliD [Selenomonadaceae bacterium]
MSSINSLGSSLLNTNYLFNSTNGTTKQDSIAKLWSGYNSYQSNAQNSLAGVTEVNTNLKALLSSYEDAKSAFNTEFEENMTNLSESASALKDYNFNVKTEGAISTETVTAEDGTQTTTTKYSEELQKALDTVTNFVDDYNSSINFLNENSSVSKRIEQLATTFSDATYRAADYESIGLTVNSDGTISVNESELAEAIVNNPEKVSSLLGEDGLAGKAEDHVDFANAQQDRLFPDAKTMLGDQLNTAAAYTGNSFANMSAYTNIGNLVNMMF